MRREDTRRFDVVVVGAGVAGCSAALAAARRGAKVALLTKIPDREESNTRYAQGGVIFTSGDDSPELLVSDILSAGSGAGSEAAAKLLASEGPEIVENLLIEELETPFDRDSRGNLLVAREGAHSVARVIHHSDTTGSEIQSSLTSAVSRDSRIEIMPGAEVTDFLLSDGKCSGVLARLGGRPGALYGNVVLATGGFAALYSHTTNPPPATGDGLALAMRSGVGVRDLHYVQFHPTVLYEEPGEAKDGGQASLISEAVRGEGAVLLTPDGDEFVEHPGGSLAPRDVVSREIARAMEETGSPCAYLDATPRSTGRAGGWFKGRFPAIHARCVRAGLDPDTDPIPVVPAAHYTCGGVTTDLTGRTTLDGLWAAGEVASTGLHGANRLASTSLLEGLVWGWRSGKDAANEGQTSSLRETRETATNTLTPAPASALESLRGIMWESAGISRDEVGISGGLSRLEDLEEGFGHTTLAGSLSVARGTLESALAADLSLGCHYRSDSLQARVPKARRSRVAR